MNNVLTIDGSYGEGGGQIVRTAVALSVVTKTPVKIVNIRAKRPIPGLRPQHSTALKCIQSICNATMNGASVGSTTLTFSPGDIKPGSYSFDIGTAGSMTLVFQACLLSVLKTPEPLTITLTGGTDVKWAPSWDYFSHVFLPLLHKFGVTTEVQLMQRGYYPTGGGKAQLTIFPIKELQPFQQIEPPSFHEIQGIIHIANLPEHISTRMKHAAIKAALKHHLQTSVLVDASSSTSSGTGITLWATDEKTILGAASLGEKSISAEQVGEQAIRRLIQEMNSGATIDYYGIDQILPYLMLAPKGSMCIVRQLSNHAQTNMWLLKQFFNGTFQLAQQQDGIQLTVA